MRVETPPGYTSTGLVAGCAPCRLRFTPREVCPTCGAGLRLVRGGSSFPDAPPGLGSFVWLATLGFAGFAIFPMGAVAFFGVVAALAWASRALVHADLRVHTDMLLPPASARTVVGVVHVVQPAISPLGTACAAWRLRGWTPGAIIDDGGLGWFDLLVDGRVVAEVRAADALLELGDAPPPSDHPVDERLAAFLVSRGVAPPRRAVSADETVLRDGDRVEVSGAAEDLVVAVGYREAASVPRFTDWPVLRYLGPAE